VSGTDARAPGSRPTIVELVGPPGVGKSTIFKSLLSRDRRFEPRPIPAKRSYLGPMGWNVLVILGMALRHRMTLSFGSRAVRSLAYLRALPQMLEKRPRDRVVVFDQGPIFLLARPGTFDERMSAWRAGALETWNALLDVVVLLDAPDEVLIDRVNARSQEHRIKGAATDVAAEFLAQSRAVYCDTLGAFEGESRGPAILRLDTSRLSAAEAADEIFTAVERVRADRDRPAAPSPL
jgi:broad-specificity NMP kinase